MSALRERFGSTAVDGLEKQRDRRVRGWVTSEKKTEWQVRVVACVFLVYGGFSAVCGLLLLECSRWKDVLLVHGTLTMLSVKVCRAAGGACEGVTIAKPR